MNDQMVRPEPLSLRQVPGGLEWFVYDSFLEKRVSQVYSTTSAAEAVLMTLISRRG